MKTSINGEFFRGHIDTIILKMLYEGDRYGYDIIKEIEQKSEGEYKIKQATLYSSLRRLEDQGFLSSYWGEKTAGGRKKFYTLTKMGKEVFVKNQSDWKKSKDIIDNLVYGKAEGDESDVDYSVIIDESENNESNNGEDSIYENVDGQSIESFFFDAPEASNAAQEELKDNFEKIFGVKRPEKSYIDSMVSQAYKPDEKKHEKVSFNFFEDDEPPYHELPPETKEKDHNFLEPPVAAQKELEPAESSMKAKAQQILLEAKAQTGSSTVPVLAQNAQKTGKQEVEFIKYSDGNERIVTDAEIIKRDYQQVLSKLIKNIKRQPQTEAINTHIQQEKKLENVRKEAILMGDSVTVRRHDNTVKQYNSENYFYKNKLMLVHYGIMFIFMLIQVAVAFAICELIISPGIITKIDLYVYIGAVILALYFPVYAFLCSYRDFYKRKLREKSFKSSLTFRIIIVLWIWTIISSVSVYRGILSDDINNYLATFFVPAVLALNVIWSYIVYICLLKSNKFNV